MRARLTPREYGHELVFELGRARAVARGEMRFEAVEDDYERRIEARLPARERYRK